MRLGLSNVGHGLGRVGPSWPGSLGVGVTRCAQLLAARGAAEVDRARCGVARGMRGGRGELRWAACGLRRRLGCLGAELDQAVEMG